MYTWYMQQKYWKRTRRVEHTYHPTNATSLPNKTIPPREGQRGGGRDPPPTRKTPPQRATRATRPLKNNYIYILYIVIVVVPALGSNLAKSWISCWKSFTRRQVMLSRSRTGTASGSFPGSPLAIVRARSGPELATPAEGFFATGR